MKIVIVGGGTAGWIAASLLASKNKLADNNGHGPTFDVTLIESKTIGIIGAGEGSTGIFADLITTKLTPLQINEVDFLYGSNATLKTGIRFKDWNGIDTEYLSPIAPSQTADYNVDLDLLSFAYYGNYYNSSPAGFMMERNLSPYYTDFKRTSGINAYHFDAHKVGEFFKGICLKNGVKLVEGEVTNLFKNSETGHLESVTVNDVKIDGDFWIDCSGFSRVLISEMGGVWKSYSEFLPANSAIPFIENLSDDDDDFRLETLAWAQPNGWMWKIPTQERYGCGYVYSDMFTNYESAVDELEKNLGKKIQPIRNLKFDSGRLENCWIKNVLATGLAGSFLEPLQATSIHTTIVQLTTFFSHCLFDTKEKTIFDANLKFYNSRIGNIVDEFKDLIQIHYMTNRSDSDFWNFCKNELKKTDKVTSVLEISKHRCLSVLDFSLLYGSAGWGVWCWTLLGLGIIRKETVYETLNNLSLLDKGRRIFNSISLDIKINSQKVLTSKQFMDALKENKIKKQI